MKVQARLQFAPSSVEAFMFFSPKQESKAHSHEKLVKQSELVLKQKAQEKEKQEENNGDDLFDLSPLPDDAPDEGLFKFEP